MIIIAAIICPFYPKSREGGVVITATSPLRLHNCNPRPQLYRESKTPPLCVHTDTHTHTHSHITATISASKPKKSDFIFIPCFYFMAILYVIIIY